MKILVTGGAGFIGTNFVYYMANKGHDVRVLDKLTYAGGKDNLEPLGSNVELLIGDICDPAAAQAAVKDCDWVVHYAAESHNTRSETDPDLFYRTNVDGTKTILDAAVQANIKRFIHISTDEVYGSIASGTFAEDDKLPGDVQATSAYSKSKALADDLAMEYGAKGYPIIVTRTTNNFGPWQFPEKALPRWITNLLMDQKIPIWGEGQQVRDWLFAPDNAEAHAFILEHGELGEAYNVAANQADEITNKQAATWVCDILKKDPAEWLDFIPDPRPDHDFRYALNTDKLAKLGWSAQPRAYEQFKETIEWYVAHPEWWQKRKAEAEKIYN